MKKLIIILCLPIFMNSCRDSDSNPENYEYKEVTSTSIFPGDLHLLNLENTNGRISITGSDTAIYINCEVTKRVKSYRSSTNAKDHINDIVVHYEMKADMVNVTVNHPMNNDIDYEVDLIITAPIIFDYWLLLGNGNVDISSVSRNLQVHVGNGNTNADVILLNNCLVSLETGNGNIMLTIPSITDAGVLATVGNGIITNTNLQYESQISSNNMFQGILGNGEGSIQITVGNGNILLEGY